MYPIPDACTHSHLYVQSSLSALRYGKVIGVRSVVLRKCDSFCGLVEIVADRTVGEMCLKID